MPQASCSRAAAHGWLVVSLVMAWTAAQAQAPGAAPGRITGLRLVPVGAASLRVLTPGSSVLAYVDGVAGGACGLAITSTAAVVQPAPFQVEARSGFPVSRQIGNFLKGTHQVTVTPVPVGASPPCAGQAISVDIAVV